MSTTHPGENASDGASRAGQAKRRERLLAELDECDAMLAEAADAGIAIEAADISIVLEARCAVERGALDTILETALAAAKGRIARALYYPNAQVSKDLKSADELLSHATLAGLHVEPADVAAIAQSRAARIEKRWNADVEASFYAALNGLSRGVFPVVAATVGKNANRGSRRAIKIYTFTAISLTLFVVALSCLMFTVNRISEDVMRIVETNDASAMMLHNQLMSHESDIIETREKQELELRRLRDSIVAAGSVPTGDEEIMVAARQHEQSELRALSNSQPALQIKEQLQQFATNNRQLYNDVTRTQGIGELLFLDVKNPYTEPDCKRAGKLHPMTTGDPDDKKLALDWTCSKVKVRANLEIRVPIMEADRTKDDSDDPQRAEDAVQEGFQKIAAYQDIRAMAMYGREIVLSLVGAVTGFVLPVLYAWLGACAAILRKIRIESETSTFHPEYSKVANRSHVTCAVIVGIAIGLFSDLVQGGKSISPLAVAFIAGYASDKFFVFVDRLVDVSFPSRVQAKECAPKAVDGSGHGMTPPVSGSAHQTGSV